MGFSTQEYWSGVPLPSLVWMWELDYEESWDQKNWCFWTVVLEKTLVSPLDCKEIQPVYPKEISPEYSLEGLMPKLKLQQYGHLRWRANTMEKTQMLGKIEAGGEEDDRGWDGWMESPTQWTWIWVGSGSGQGGLACCIPWGCKESDTTEWLNWTDWNNYTSYFLMNVVDTFILINFQTINQCCVSGINTKINKINPILFKACVCAL